MAMIRDALHMSFGWIAGIIYFIILLSNINSESAYKDSELIIEQKTIPCINKKVLPAKGYKWLKQDIADIEEEIRGIKSDIHDNADNEETVILNKKLEKYTAKLKNLTELYANRESTLDQTKTSAARFRRRYILSNRNTDNRQKDNYGNKCGVQKIEKRLVNEFPDYSLLFATIFFLSSFLYSFYYIAKSGINNPTTEKLKIVRICFLLTFITFVICNFGLNNIRIQMANRHLLMKNATT